MEEIIAEARELGKKISQHPRVIEFMTAARAVSEDRDAQDALRGYQEQAQRVRSLEAGGKPIEVADKRKLAECEARVAGNDKLKRMMKHQADYVELMTRINNAMEDAIQGEAE